MEEIDVNHVADFRGEAKEWEDGGLAKLVRHDWDNLSDS